MPPHSTMMASRPSPARIPSRRDEVSVASSNLSQNSRKPSSVYLAPIPLSRELSDLSGSYVNGQGNRGALAVVPGMIFEQKPDAGPWKPSNILSKLTGSGTSVQSSNSASRSCIPVNVLLMDGSQNAYELLQIWMDRSTDAVRDVLQAVQRAIPASWAHSYDGIFQVRGNRFTQLIHILRMAKYDIQPNEILIAKPISMSAQVAIAFANSAIRHLTHVGIVNTDEKDASGHPVFRPKSEKSPLLLSLEAQHRIHVPRGSATHHHAVNFLAFSPPLDTPARAATMPDVHHDDALSSVGSHFSSLGSVHTNTRPTPRHRKGESFRSLNRSLDEGIQEETSVQESRQQPEPCKQHQVAPPSTTASYGRTASSVDNPTEESVASHEYHSGRKGRKGKSYVMSQLNCCRPKERIPSFEETTLVDEYTNGAFACWKAPKSLEPPLVMHSFDVRPIAEEYSQGSKSSTASSRKPTSLPATPLVHVPSLSGFHKRSSSGYRGRQSPQTRLLEFKS
eukprot:Nitzschia sp. Nitz4//scaffold9_size221794//29218//30824//NITZ4_001322-RA/size221794-snap-gene-0.126-mRNA-1//-1//CDS//3329560929//7608//frame0